MNLSVVNVDDGLRTAVDEVSPIIVSEAVLSIVTAPLRVEMVDEVERKPLFVSSPPTVTLPFS